jgi:hypothetical protein
MPDKYRVKISIHRLTPRKGEKVKPGFDLNKQVNADSFREAYDRVAKVADTVIEGLDQDWPNG